MSTYGSYGTNQSLGSSMCYRHPERVTHIQCQRCGRPICGECQINAAVGVQCADCVRSGQQTVRQPTTVFGAAVRPGPPVITYTIIALCLISYLAQLTMGWEHWTSRLAFVPMLGEEEPWRFVTAAFVHSQNQVTHILFNMFALYMVGPVLEQALGRLRFLTLYLLSAIGGSVAVLLLAGQSMTQETFNTWLTAVVGASGAVFGLFAALFVVLRRVQANTSQIVVIVAINVVIGFVVPGISWQGHLGGLIIGGLLAVAYAKAPRGSQRAVAVLAPAVILALLAIATIWFYGNAPEFYEIYKQSI